MKVAGNKEQVAQKMIQREQLKRKAADERAEEAREKAGEEKKQRRKAEKENKQLATKNQVLAKLPFVAVAAGGSACGCTQGGEEEAEDGEAAAEEGGRAPTDRRAGEGVG